jgi:hypothetical protein
MRESRTYGSVRGALSNERPYRDQIARLEDLCSTAAVNVPRRTIATAFQCAVFVRRSARGCQIEEVLNISGFEPTSGRYFTQSAM